MGGLDEEVHAKVTQKRFFLEIVPIVLFANFQVWGFLAQTQYTRAISRAF